MKLIYIAGPYSASTHWQVATNVREAEGWGRKVALLGHMPAIPHVLGRHYGDEQTPQFWYDGTLLLMMRCDAVLMIPGWEKSKGAVNERKIAKRIMPVYYSVEEIPLP